MTLSHGTQVVGRAVIVATEASYRRLGIPSFEELVGTGVFYGAAATEARAMEGQEVYVVGGANSAGRAAIHLSRYASRVTLLVRSDCLVKGISDYLIKEIEATSNIVVQSTPRSSTVAGRGDSNASSSRTLLTVGRGQFPQPHSLYSLVPSPTRSGCPKRSCATRGGAFSPVRTSWAMSLVYCPDSLCNVLPCL